METSILIASSFKHPFKWQSSCQFNPSSSKGVRWIRTSSRRSPAFRSERSLLTKPPVFWHKPFVSCRLSAISANVRLELRTKRRAFGGSCPLRAPSWAVLTLKAVRCGNRRTHQLVWWATRGSCGLLAAGHRYFQRIWGQAAFLCQFYWPGSLVSSSFDAHVAVPRALNRRGGFWGGPRRVVLQRELLDGLFNSAPSGAFLIRPGDLIFLGRPFLVTALLSVRRGKSSAGPVFRGRPVDSSQLPGWFCQ